MYVFIHVGSFLFFKNNNNFGFNVYTTFLVFKKTASVDNLLYFLTASVAKEKLLDL